MALDQLMYTMKDSRPTDPVLELTTAYSIGDLHLRLASPTDAVKWFAQASQLPEFKKQPEIQRLLRERWLEARDIVRARAAARTS